LLAAITHGNNRFVAVGAAGTILTSADGVAWRNEVSGTSSDLFGVAFGNNVFVAAGASGTILSSPDAVTWTRRDEGLGTWFRAVAFGGGRFVLVASNGPILSSPDGVEWTRSDVAAGQPGQFLLASYDLRSVAWGNNRFVATGERFAVQEGGHDVEDPGLFAYIYGPVLTSPDGVNWTDEDPLGETLSGVAFGNGTFVLVGSGPIHTSVDGTAWAVQAAPGSGRLLGVTFGDGRFVAVGSSGAMMISPDGVTWTSRQFKTARALTAVAAGGDAWLQIVRFGNRLTLSWPSAVDQSVLQAADTLSPSGGWSTVLEAPAKLGDRLQITLVPDGPSRFYHLEVPDDRSGTRTPFRP
jgi:hypothetical protein